MKAPQTQTRDPAGPQGCTEIPVDGSDPVVNFVIVEEEGVPFVQYEGSISDCYELDCDSSVGSNCWAKLASDRDAYNVEYQIGTQKLFAPFEETPSGGYYAVTFDVPSAGDNDYSLTVTNKITGKLHDPRFIISRRPGKVAK